MTATAPAITSGDVKWLAGYLEGEGTFYRARGTEGVKVASTDRDVVARAARLLGGTVAGPYTRNPRHKVQYVTAVFGYRAIGWMMTLYTEMGQRRREKIRECLASWRSRRRRPNGGGTVCHPDRPHHAHGLCGTCEKGRQREEKRHAAAR